MFCVIARRRRYYSRDGLAVRIIPAGQGIVHPTGLSLCPGLSRSVDGEPSQAHRCSRQRGSRRTVLARRQRGRDHRFTARGAGRSIVAFGVGSKLHVLSNGYDPEELADIAPYDFGHFAIVYAGNFYPPKRVISPIMAALERLLKTTDGNNREWFFHYYGRHEDHVLEEARKFGVTEKVISHGWVPQSEALAAVRGAGLTIVISSVDDQATVADKGIMTGKVYEALGLNVPVLVVAPQGSDLETLAKRQIDRQMSYRQQHP